MNQTITIIEKLWTKRIRKRYYKTFGASVINNLMSPPSLTRFSFCSFKACWLFDNNVLYNILLYYTLDFVILISNTIIMSWNVSFNPTNDLGLNVPSLPENIMNDALAHLNHRGERNIYLHFIQNSLFCLLLA